MRREEGARWEVWALAEGRTPTSPVPPEGDYVVVADLDLGPLGKLHQQQPVTASIDEAAEEYD